MKKAFFLLLVIIIFISCDSKHQFLSSYYFNNTEIHTRISKELMSFCKTWNCEVTLRQSPEIGNIVFEYHINNNPEFESIEFDSLFKRTDPRPDRTSNAYVPIHLLKDFKKGIYHAIIADSNEVFFGHEFIGKKNFEIGVLVWRQDIRISSDRI
jgi:hypothetical protein